MLAILAITTVATTSIPALAARGDTWTGQTAAEANGWDAVAYGNGTFVAVAQFGTNRVMTSPDGVTWTAQQPAEANGWDAVAYGNGVFVAVSQFGANRVMTSPDGRTWTAHPAAAASGWQSVAFGGGQFVAVALTGPSRVMTSPDGVTWTAHAAAEANEWISVTYGSGVFVAVSQSGTNRVMTSPDGVTWTPHLAASPNRWTSVTYGNGMFVAVGNVTNIVMTSPDGATWTAHTASVPSSWRWVAYGDGVFVAIATLGAAQIMTSPDGATWTSQTTPGDSEWTSIAYGSGLFVAVADNGFYRVMTSGSLFVAPSITAPAVNVGTDPGQCGASVSYDGLVVTGNPTPTVAASPPSGSYFGVGATTVSVSAESTAGTTLGSFAVNVSDTELPKLLAPGLMSVNATGPAGASVSYPPFTATDNCPGTTVAATRVSGSQFAIGNTVVVGVARDRAGNHVNAGFVVHVDGAAAQLAKLSGVVTGVGVGTSLKTTIGVARLQLAVRHRPDACRTLGIFILQVSLQTPMSISGATARGLVLDAQRIRAVVGCS